VVRQITEDGERAAKSKKLMTERAADSLCLGGKLRSPAGVPAAGRTLGFETASQMRFERALHQHAEGQRE
jgi:hypothetical protein